MYALTGGETFILGFIMIAVLSWPVWPWIGEKIASAVGKGGSPRDPEPPERT
jgi:hypothetical protein